MRLVNVIGLTPIVSETNQISDFKAIIMPVLAGPRLHLIDPSSTEHNSACLFIR